MEYLYRVTCGFCVLMVGLLWDSGYAHSVKSSLGFLVVGDSGGISFHPYTTPVQTSVAGRMAEVAEREGTEFNLMLGDNFYLYGVQSVDDPRFDVTFEKVYSAPSLHTPWYVIAGNHDHFGNVSAQILYSQRSSRWKFPDYYHRLSYPVPGGKRLEILMLDTIVLCGNVFSLAQPAGPADPAAAEKQWAWLEDKLKASSADYIIVAGHYPVWSVSLHGPTTCLVNRLEPLLYKYNVTAYLAGHDHNLQHIVKKRGGHTVHHVVVGCGNFVDTSQQHLASVAKEELKFFWAELLYLGGFSKFDVSDSGISFQFIDGVGHKVYYYTIPNST